MQSHIQDDRGSASGSGLDLTGAHGVVPSEDPLGYVVAVATRAPSIHNSQPWRFVATYPDVLDVFAERSRQLPVADPEGRQLHISVGAALHHAMLAFHSVGRSTEVTLLPDPRDPDLLARIRTRPAAVPFDPTERALLSAVSARHTHRAPFTDGRLPKSLLVDLATAARQQGSHVHFVEVAGERRMLADTVAEATRRLEADPAYRNEVLIWTGREGDSTDGVPRSAVAPSATGDEFRQRSFGPATHVWISEGDAEHPDILLLWSPGDSPEEWLRTGVALSALLLTAASAGVGASMLNQPLEIPALRARIVSELRLPGYPQMLMRLGYSAGDPPTPRRPVTDVLTPLPPTADA